MTEQPTRQIGDERRGREIDACLEALTGESVELRRPIVTDARIREMSL